MREAKIAVLVPCYNEEATVEKVVRGFRRSLPKADIYVFDNNSKDKTSEIAHKSGAIVQFVPLAGKGNVVRRMFADVDADIYVMVDGDATYDAPSAPKLVQKLIDENLDMVVGCRTEESVDNNNYRLGHRLGNKLLTGSVQKMFGGNFTDMLSGYRVFSRRFVKSFPAESKRFETETELTVHTLEMKMPYGEMATPYFERPIGSESKLSTYKDGIRILKMIVRLYSSERPSRFWAIIGGAFLLIAAVVMIPVLVEYLQTDLVQRFPTVIVASGMGVIGIMCGTIGLVLRTVTKGRNEAKHLSYLRIPSLRNEINR
jgi:glycosyltransferase involved in cell wall biosynthesis